jgi:glycosyltransferase involved in cell wall biosynthesis
LVNRDYRTLARATEGLEVDIEVCAASSMPAQLASTMFPEEHSASFVVKSHSLRELRDLYRGADVVVVPLLPKAGGGVTVIAEAMSTGAAVIATDSNDDISYLGQLGLIEVVPPADAEALRHAIVALVDDPDRRGQLGAKARDFVVRHMSNEVGARRLSDAMGAPHVA